MVCCNTWFHLVPMQRLVDQTHCHLFYKKWQGLTENETFYKSGTNFLNEITFLCELIHTLPLSFLEAYLSLFPASGGPIPSVLPGSCRGLLILPNTVKDWLALQGPPVKARLCTCCLLYLQCVLPSGSCSSFNTHLHETFLTTHQGPVRALHLLPTSVTLYGT